MEPGGVEAEGLPVAAILRLPVEITKTLTSLKKPLKIVFLLPLALLTTRLCLLWLGHLPNLQSSIFIQTSV